MKWFARGKWSLTHPVKVIGVQVGLKSYSRKANSKCDVRPILHSSRFIQRPISLILKSQFVIDGRLQNSSPKWFLCLVLFSTPTGYCKEALKFLRLLAKFYIFILILIAQKWGCHLIRKVGFRINWINYVDQHCFQNGCNEDGKRDFYFLFTVKYMYFKFLWEQGSLDRTWNDIAMIKLIKDNACIWTI